MRIDLHVHSSISDGTDTPTRLVMQALSADLDVIGLCDHDTFDGITEAAEAGRRVGVSVLPGIEVSAEIAGRGVHVLGYGCDAQDAELNAELKRIRSGRADRIAPTIDALREAGLEITVADVEAIAIGAPSVGRPHIADALVAKGYVADRDEAFATYLAEGQPGFVGRYAPSVERVIDLIHGARGAAVIAHPWGRGGEEVVTAEYLAQLVSEHQLEGIEVDHQDHTADQRELLFRLGARLGLIRTGSSDYHGRGKSGHDLGSNLTRKSAYLDLIARIKARGGVTK